MNETAKTSLRLMYALLVARYQEYDRAGFSAEYWRITDEYEAAKAAYRSASLGTD